MRYRVTIVGVSPIIMHNGVSGIATRSPAKLEIKAITAKRGTRSEADEARLVELECLNSLYLDDDGKPTVPETAIRAAIEAAARKTKQGPAVREGLLVEAVEQFEYDEKRYGTTVDELAQSAQFTVPVVVQRARVARTRARFDLPWKIVATVDVDDELIDEQMLLAWLDTAGRRIGLCDWRPQCSGTFGRFTPQVQKI